MEKGKTFHELSRELRAEPIPENTQPIIKQLYAQNAEFLPKFMTYTSVIASFVKRPVIIVSVCGDPHFESHLVRCVSHFSEYEPMLLRVSSNNYDKFAKLNAIRKDELIIVSMIWLEAIDNYPARNFTCPIYGIDYLALTALKPDVVLTVSAPLFTGSMKFFIELEKLEEFYEDKSPYSIDSTGLFWPESLILALKSKDSSFADYKSIDLEKIMSEYEIDFDMFIDDAYHDTIVKILHFECPTVPHDRIICTTFTTLSIKNLILPD